MTSLHRRSALLAVSLDPHEICVCRLRRQGKQSEVSVQLRAPIPANVFRTAPTRAGQELRTALQNVHIRPEHCVVCLPLSWAFTAEIDLPELSEADLQGFIQLEAERRFPLSSDDLMLSLTHRQTTPTGLRALLIGVSREYLSNIGKALQIAKLTPTHITFGISMLQEACAEKHALLLQLGKGFADLAILNEGAIPRYKNLVWQEGATPSDLPSDIREMSRQLRIVLAQLPAEQRAAIASATVYGDGEWSAEALPLLTEAFAGLNLTLEPGESPVHSDVPEVPVGLLACATHILSGKSPVIELVSKQHNRLRSMLGRFSARRTRSIFAAIGMVIFLLGATFGLQAQKLASLEQQWAMVAPQIKEARDLQERIKKYRSWYDENIPSLAIATSLFTAFPEDGTVWIKSLVIKDQTKVTCSGSASDRKDWMDVLAKLGMNRDLENLKVNNTRGVTPFSFTLEFQWKGTEAHGR